MIAKAQVRALVSRRETFYRGEGRRVIIVKCVRTKSFPLVTSKFHREACPATLRLFVSLGNKLVLLNYGHLYFATELSTCPRFSSSLAITFNHESRKTGTNYCSIIRFIRYKADNREYEKKDFDRVRFI